MGSLKLDSIYDQVRAGERINPEQGLALFTGADLLTLGRLADGVRKRKHPEGAVTFIIDRNINYTNICVSGCRFCAFYRSPGSPGGYVLTRERIFRKIDETIAGGGTQLLMQGGLNPELGLEYFEDLFKAIKERYQIKLHSLSPVEIDFLTRISGLPLHQVIARLKEAGLDSIAGGGAEILSDRVRRRISPKKTSAARWLEVAETAHQMGLRSSATMMFGVGEQPEDRIAHLEAIRSLQDRTGGFTAFIPWTYQPGHTELGGEAASAWDYLKTLALSRIYLDNIDNLQVSWVTQGVKVAQVALFFGANDFGSTMMEENVVRAAGVSNSSSAEELVSLIQNAGFRAARRDNLYQILQRYD